jgi:hypothetical protein
VTPYSGEYDGSLHDAMTVTGDHENDTFTYSTDGESFSSKMPAFMHAGTYTVYVQVQRTGYTTLITDVQVVISQASGSISITSSPSKTYDGLPASSPSFTRAGTGGVTFTWHGDNGGAIGTLLTGAPADAGTY